MPMCVYVCFNITFPNSKEDVHLLTCATQVCLLEIDDGFNVAHSGRKYILRLLKAHCL